MGIQMEIHLGKQMEIQKEKHSAMRMVIRMESCSARNLDWPKG